MGGAWGKHTSSAEHAILPLKGSPLKPQHSGICSRRVSLYLGRLAFIVLVILSLSVYRNSAFPPKQSVVSVARNPAYLIHAHNGAVASENKRCSDIGVEVLKDGGNAVDAVIAATFCTGVVNMFS